MQAAMDVEAPPPIQRDDANRLEDDSYDSDEWEDAIVAAPVVQPRQGRGVPFAAVPLPFEESPSATRRACSATTSFGNDGSCSVAPRPVPMASSGRGSPSLNRRVVVQAPLEQPAPPIIGEEPPEVDEDEINVVWVKGRAVKMRKADCTRASREGRPSEPSARSMAVCRELARLREVELKGLGRTRLTTCDYTRPVRATITSSGKGAAVKAPAPENQAKVNHLANLKSRDVESYNTEASFLLCDKTAEQQYDRLAESALRANAGNQAVTKRKQTQGAANQTPYAHASLLPLLLSGNSLSNPVSCSHRRINSKAIGQAAAPQCINVALSIALSEHILCVDHGVKIRNPLATIAVDPAALVANGASLPTTDTGLFVAVVSTSELVYNAHPTKLGTACIRSVAQTLAKRELKEHAISERMSSANYMLDAICRSIGGGYEIDSTWASVVLIVYLSCDPRGRPLLAESGLTDLDLQTAYVLESYGRSEITRRARLAETQANGDGPVKKRPRKGRGRDPEPDPEPEEEEPVDVLSPHSSEDQRTLATKKRRASRGLASASCSDAHGVIDYWFRALRSEDSSVLETLIASSRDAARDASQATLERQSDGVSDVAANRTLRQMGAQNAVKSVEELVKFVHKAPRDIPAIVAMSSKWDGLVMGFAPVAQQANRTVLHATSVLDRSLQPPQDSHIVVLHSTGMQEMAPRGTDTQTVPGILERYACLAETREVAKAPPSRGDRPASGKQAQVQFLGNTDKVHSFHGKRAISGIERFICDETHNPILSNAAGITRTVVSLRMSMPINQSTIDAAVALTDEAIALRQKVAKDIEGSNGASSSRRDDTPVRLLATSRKPELRREPLCTPCSRMGIGLRLNELLRRWMAGRTRKNYPAMVLCGLRTNAEVSKDQPLIIDTEPLPLAIMTDFSLKALPGITDVGGGATHTTVGAAIHMCVDGAVRVPELLTRISDMFQRRALLYVSASQASYIGDVGSAVSAVSANCSSANSKKVSCPDINTLVLATHWDCYVGGLTNVQRSFANTPYTGTVGPRIDTGASPPGLFANYYRSDHRGHGSISLSQEAADEICGMLSNSHHVEVGKDQYVLSPVQVRGIPHGFVPDVHTVLDDYSAALETVRKLSGREEESTVDGTFVCPVTPWMQALAPDIEGTVDSTLRNAFRDPTQTSTATGRSYLPDATDEREAIFVEPMWRRPCQASVGDNPFSTAYDHADSMFNAANTIAYIAIEIGEGGGFVTSDGILNAFHQFVTKAVFADTHPEASSPSYLWVTDFLWLVFGAVYPHKHAIDEVVVPSSIAKLSAAMARQCKLQADGGVNPVGASLTSLLNPEELAEVRELWSRFSRRPSATCAWTNGLKPLLQLILTTRGRHDVSLETVQAYRTAVDNIPRSAFLVYSVDGKAPPPGPNPLSDCSGPNSVRRPHVDPVFVATGDILEIEPRGALVGLKPFQLRQGYVMLLGAHIEGVVPQVIRNEGGLSLRLSSAADILEESGEERTDKAIAPLQTEADQAAFGTREAKLYGCALQRSAWDRNSLALAPLFAAINPPQDKQKRARGEWGDASWLKEYLIGEREKQRTLDVERIARNQLERAAKCATGVLRCAL